MANYYAKWSQSAIRPTLFGVIDAYAGIPLFLCCFRLNSLLLWQIAFSLIGFLTILKYLGYTPNACLIATRRHLGRLFTGGPRQSSQPFEIAIKRVR